MGFGILVPGRNLQTDFKQVSKTRWIMELDNKVSITEIMVFKLPNTPSIPNNFAMGIYIADQTKK